MSRELFGTDGVRGKAGAYPLDDVTVRKIGLAIGCQFGGIGKTILVGRDPRESSPEITLALIEGLINSGSDIKIVGVIPTPGLAYLTTKTGSSAGVMVTASHNPYSDNGIKVFTAKGEKLTDKQEVSLNAKIENSKTVEQKGKSLEDNELAKDYEDFIIHSASGVKLDSIKLAIDTANGAASGYSQRIFSKLGADVTALFDQPDGRNINQNCGATSPDNLIKVVIDKKLDRGIGLDGDADRVVLVDERGRQLNGDHILYILAVTGGHKGVVTTVMSNYGFEKALVAKGIKLHRTAVGDRYVAEGLHQTGYQLGGEQSGHVIIGKYIKTGDGLLAAVQTLIAVKTSDKSLSQWRDELEFLPQAVVNIEVSDKSVIDSPPVQKIIAKNETALAGKGRVLLRASGTEPLLRLMIEGPDAQKLAESAAQELKQIIGKPQ